MSLVKQELDPADAKNSPLVISNLPEKSPRPKLVTSDSISTLKLPDINLATLDLDVDTVVRAIDRSVAMILGGTVNLGDGTTIITRGIVNDATFRLQETRVQLETARNQFVQEGLKYYRGPFARESPAVIEAKSAHDQTIKAYKRSITTQETYVKVMTAQGKMTPATRERWYHLIEAKILINSLRSKELGAIRFQELENLLQWHLQILGMNAQKVENSHTEIASNTLDGPTFRGYQKHHLALIEAKKRKEEAMRYFINQQLQAQNWQRNKERWDAVGRNQLNKIHAQEAQLLALHAQLAGVLIVPDAEKLKTRLAKMREDLNSNKAHLVGVGQKRKSLTTENNQINLAQLNYIESNLANDRLDTLYPLINDLQKDIDLIMQVTFSRLPPDLKAYLLTAPVMEEQKPVDELQRCLVKITQVIRATSYSRIFLELIYKADKAEFEKDDYLLPQVSLAFQRELIPIGPPQEYIDHTKSSNAYFSQISN